MIPRAGKWLRKTQNVLAFLKSTLKIQKDGNLGFCLFFGWKFYADHI